jgi:CDP-glucose 4,6-dehydratase
VIDRDAPYGGRRVLVTGATGIVGSWLVEALLSQRATVVALVRDEPENSELIRSGNISRVDRVRGGLEDVRLLQRMLADYDIDVIFHLGAQTQVTVAERDPLGTMEANVRGTYNLLEAVRVVRPGALLVVASSDKAYGHSERLPYTEAHPLAGRGIYDASKSAADLIASAYARSYDLPIAIARCGNIYGGGDTNWDRIVPSTVRALLLGDRPVLRSDGKPRRDYLYVRDAVSAYLRLGEALADGIEPGDAFNFGNGKPVTVLDIVRALQNITERPDLEPVILAEAGMEIPDQFLDSSKARARLGWSPEFDLQSGLTETVEWYRRLLKT